MHLRWAMRDVHGVFVLVVLVGCGPDFGGDSDPGAGGGGGGGGDPGTLPPGIPTADAKVYAHSATDLYTVDPSSLTVSHVAPFAWPAGQALQEMTDIAIDSQGRMVGISLEHVYAIDPTSAQVTYLADLAGEPNGLSFIASSELADGGDVLVAAVGDGTFHRLDPTTGQATLIGRYGEGMASSGDVVSVAGFGTVATAEIEGSATDWLVRVDPATGAATPIGETGASGIWGLGFWGGTIYGFSESREFLTIDPVSGRAKVRETGQVDWWGAGVTTEAPILD